MSYMKDSLNIIVNELYKFEHDIETIGVYNSTFTNSGK